MSGMSPILIQKELIAFLLSDRSLPYLPITSLRDESRGVVLNIIHGCSYNQYNIEFMVDPKFLIVSDS